MAKAKDTRIIEFSAFAGKLTDPPHEGNVRRFAKFDGLDAMPMGETAVAVAESPDGYEPLHFAPLTRNPAGPALPPDDMGELFDRRGTLTLLAAKFPGINGNIFASVREGDSDSSPTATTLAAGKQGEIPHVYPELWNTPPVPLVSRNLSTSGDLEPPDENEQPEPPEPEDPVEMINPDFMAYAIQDYHEESGERVYEANWSIYLVNVGTETIYHFRSMGETEDSQKEPVGGEDHTDYFSFTSALVPPATFLTVPVVDLDVNPVPLLGDYATVQEFQDAFDQWVIDVGALGGIVTVPTPIPGATRAMQVTFKGSTDSEDYNPWFRRSVPIIWYEPPSEPSEPSEQNPIYDTRAAWWPAWDGDPMIEEVGVLTAEEALAVDSISPYGFRDLTPKNPIDVGQFGGIFPLPGLNNGMVTAWRGLPNIPDVEPFEGQGALWLSLITSSQTYSSVFNSEKSSKEWDQSNIPNTTIQISKPDGTYEFTELLSRESTAIRRVGAVNQRVQGIDNPIRITDLCPYFYKLRVRRSFGTPYYVVRVYNKGSVSISIESMQIDFPFSQFDDPGNYDIELLGTGKNVRPGTHRDIIVTKTVDAIGGTVGCPGENNINLSPSIFPDVFDMSISSKSPGFNFYFGKSSYVRLRVDIAEGADLRRIDFPLMFVTTGRSYWNEYQSADEDWNNPEFIDILVAAPVDRFMGIVSGSPVLAPAFMMGDLSEIGYNATTYDMILNVSSAVMYYNISVFPSCTVNGSSESRAFDDMAYSSSGPFKYPYFRPATYLCPGLNSSTTNPSHAIGDFGIVGMAFPWPASGSNADFRPDQSGLYNIGSSFDYPEGS